MTPTDGFIGVFITAGLAFISSCMAAEFFHRKQEVLHTEIFLPENVPAWMADCEKPWN